MTLTLPLAVKANEQRLLVWWWVTAVKPFCVCVCVCVCRPLSASPLFPQWPLVRGLDVAMATLWQQP